MTSVSKITISVALGVGLLAWAVASYAAADRGDRGHPAFRSAEEVLTGSYSCTGTVFTDEQEPEIYAGAWLTATSGITQNYYGSGNSSRNVPADLDAMASICDAHVEEVLSMIPGICALGPVLKEGGEFGNGANVSSRFNFSCQGSRNAVIGVIGGFSHASVIVPLP
ncbi:MAG: hypothetical protein JRF15_11490 [Deltaproteobacteria bacterium]|jgi:hypothetical protein|nr:hypothetical protein [Deltaproteobacteria bacterium]